MNDPAPGPGKVQSPAGALAPAKFSARGVHYSPVTTSGAFSAKAATWHTGISVALDHSRHSEKSTEKRV